MECIGRQIRSSNILKSQKKETPCSLDSARKLIIAHARRTEGESVNLDDALCRVPVESLRAKKPQPGYDQSSRDGFVVSGEGAERVGQGYRFHIEGEIRAGSTGRHALSRGAACRIMTGGLVPGGGVRVVPQEDCEEDGGGIFVAGTVMRRPETFIRKRGAEIGRGRVVVPTGTSLLPDHLVHLAATGHSAIEVYRRPRVAFFCTGSELVASPADERDGLKVSGNRYLLNGLIRMAGGVAEDGGRVADSNEDLSAALTRIDRKTTDAIITTGGMGPGRYDLLESSFVHAGGRIVFRSLHIRPGKATLFGLFGNTLFFGLPGPPPAVGVLFNELVAPALYFLQGMKKCRPLQTRAFLEEAVMLKNTGVPSLRGGVLTKGDKVRFAGKFEAPGCFILFPGHRRAYQKGERVEVHPALPFTHSFL
jgi:molybdopterin molybdotransferase